MRDGPDRAAGRALQHLQQPGRPGGGAVLLRRQRHPRGGEGLRQPRRRSASSSTPGLADRADVEIIIRPQHLKMDFDRNGAGPLPTSPDGVPARGRVVARALRRQPEHRRAGDGPRRLGAEGDDSRASSCRRPGTPLWLSLRRDRCFVFPVPACRALRRRTRIAAPMNSPPITPADRLGFACAGARPY